MYETSGVELLDMKTTKVISFKSMRECARFLGIKVGSVHWRLRVNRGLSHCGYLFRFLDENVSWDTILSLNSAIDRKIGVSIVNIETREVEHYKSMVELGNRLGCSSAFICRRIRVIPDKPYKGYLIIKGDVRK